MRLRDRLDPWVVNALSAMKSQPSGLRVKSRILAHFANRKAHRPSPRRFGWRLPLTTAVLAGTAIAAVALAASSRSTSIDPADPPAVRMAPAAMALLETNTDPSQPEFDGYAIVLGPEPLRAAGLGPVRIFAAGSLVPSGLLVRPEPGQRSTVRVGGRAEVRLDPGAEMSIEPPQREREGVLLTEGRLSVEVRQAARPFVVRLADAGAEMWAHRASFGVLAAGGGRWSAAVTSGGLEVPRPSDTVRVSAVSEVGGGPGQGITARPISAALEIELRTERTDRGWMLRGLTDLLARVEVEGRVMPLDANGEFRFAPGKSPNRLHVVAVDASGRKVERTIESPGPAVSPAVSPKEASAPRKAEKGSEPIETQNAPDASSRGAEPKQANESKQAAEHATEPSTEKSTDVPLRVRLFRW